MPRAHALLLESIHATAREQLAEGDVAVDAHGKALGEDELIAALAAVPGNDPIFLGLRSKTHVPAHVFDRAPRLEAIGAFCIGTDQIDLAAARRHGVAVFNAPFSSTRSVAELVISEVIMLSRQIYARCRAAHDGKWDKTATGAHEVRGKTLGIVGYGHIGSQVGILAEAFGMSVWFYDIDKKLPLGNVRGTESLLALLRSSDFVTLHVPDTELTRNMIGESELAEMRPGSHLLNLSRGKVVDIAALRRALDSGHLAGAAVDVFPLEPASTSDIFESELRGCDRVILTPHVGGSTQEAQANIGLEVSNALRRFLDQGSTQGCVTLPPLDMPRTRGACRLVNVHRNVPGVLSQINRVVADSGVNIVGQALATNEDVGLLFVDVPLRVDEASALAQGIARLPTSVRTRLIA